MIQLRHDICDAAVKLAKNISYINAGTVEFLVSDGNFYFIEVNPRIQVEHTITEMVTGIDIVHSQIHIANGGNLHEGETAIPAQEDIPLFGYAIQSRVTTEDPLNDFMPDTGKLMVYRSGGGFGVRLDAGNGFQGAVITPYYDSLARQSVDLGYFLQGRGSQDGPQFPGIQDQRNQNKYSILRECCPS